jgi:serine/threonine protein kinase
MSNLIGQQLGNYRLTRLLGQGAFAEVYLGEHVRLNMFTAIKVLHAHLSEEEKAAFQREALVIAELVHPNIVRVLDFDIKENRPFLVLDYAPNGSLRQHHPKGTRIPLAQVVTYVKQVADALQYAHDRKLIHRDVKPENMLLGRQNQVLLSDFGIVVMAHSTSSMSNTQTSMGTIPYMAPEQIQALPRPASDQYSLGIVVYQWLSGELPFQGSPNEVIAKHLSTPPPSLHPKIPDLSPEVERVLFTALAKDPKDRFGSVQDFANALEQASKHNTPQVMPPSPTKAKTPPPTAAIPELPATPPVTRSTNTPAGQTPYPAYGPAQPYPYPYVYPGAQLFVRPYISMPPVSPEAKQGRQKFAFMVGLIFSIVLWVEVGVFTLIGRLPNLTNPTLSSTLGAILIISILSCYCFSSMITARRTWSVGMGRITGLWLTLCLFGIMAMTSSSTNNYENIFTNIMYSAPASPSIGAIGPFNGVIRLIISIFAALIASSFGSMFGRNQAWKASIQKMMQTNSAKEQRNQ